MTPLTREWRHRRIEMARRGVAELATFNSGQLTDAQRVSADLMKWQLEVVVEGDKVRGFRFSARAVCRRQYRSGQCAYGGAPAQHGKGRVELCAAPWARSRAAWRRPPLKRVISPPKAWCRRGSSFAPRLRRCSSSSACRSTEPVRDCILRADGCERRHSRRPNARTCAPSRAHHCRADLSCMAESDRRDGAARRPSRPMTPGYGDSRTATRSYAYQLRRFTSTDLSADAIHQIGLREVAQNRNRDGRDTAAARAERMVR